MSKQIQVLHVDDEPDFADLTATFLERENDRLSVETATSAEEGLEQLRENEYDCVVSDYDMPKKDGIEFLESARKKYPDFPFILFTGEGSEEVASEAISKGVTDYLQKRFGSEGYKLLANRIKNAVRARRNAKRAERKDELMRLTEVAGNTGGFEVDVETEDLVLTDGARRLGGISEDEQICLEEAIGMHPPEEQKRLRDAIDRVAETGETSQDTYLFMTRDGDERLVELTMTPVEKNGGVTKVRGGIKDITEQRERQQELEQIETLFEHSQDSLFLIDVGEDFTVERVNPAYEEATGLSSEDMRGRTLKDIYGEDGADMEKRYAECVKKEEPLEYDEQVRLNGKLTHWETKIAPVVLNGEIEYVVGSTRDITEQKKRQKELKRYEKLVRRSSDVIQHMDEDGTLLYQSPGTEEMFGHEPGINTGENAFEYVHPDDSERVIEEFTDGLADPETETATVELRLEDDDGEYVWTEAAATDQTDTELGGVIASLRDITERKEREKELKETQERLDLAVEAGGLGVWDWDIESDEIQHNEQWAEMFGLPPDEGTVSVESVMERCHPDRVSELEKVINEVLTGNRDRYDIEIRLKTADGDWKWIRTVGQVAERYGNGKATRLVGVNVDIDELKRQKEELERYKTFVESSPDVITHLSVDGEILYQSSAIEKIGYSQDESVGDTAFEYVHPDDREKTQQEFFELLGDPERDSGMVEYRVLNGEGEYIWAEAIGRDHRDTEAGGIVIIQRDISKRKERERAVERAYEQLRQIIDLIPDPIFAKSLDDEVLFSNEANAELHGMTPEELEGRTEREIEPEVENIENFEKYRQREKEVIETADPMTFQEELMDPDGETHVFNTTRIPFETASTEEDAVLGYARDITSLKEYEQELKQSNEKLNQFASVVSHDLRNPLSVAEGRLELAQEDCDSEHLDDVEGALERMEALIEDILTLAREGSDVGEMEVIETEEMLEECWSNVETGNATVMNELERKIEADPGRLKQVCENLLRNAIEHGGEGVTVTVGELDGGNGFYVADDGEGIPEEERDDVFNTGYSISEQGTGFGLSIVEEIVTAHDWEIEVTESKDGGGRFEISGVEMLEEA